MAWGGGGWVYFWGLRFGSNDWVLVKMDGELAGSLPRRCLLGKRSDILPKGLSLKRLHWESSF